MSASTSGPLPPGQTRDQLVAEVAAVLSVLPSGTAVCLAVSGGPDSTALAYLTAEARPDLDLTLVHVRHGLRDDAADREVVAGHATWLGLPLVEREVEVRPAGEGIEAAAREARYRALRAVAAEVGAAAILVGHTADDQAETVLLRLTRGTGLPGLAAMVAVTGDLVRPLLRIRREDVRRFVLLEGLPTAEDPTNTDPALRRTGVRHRLLPLLEEAAPDPVGALSRLADLARDDAAALDDWAAEVASAARRAGPVVAIADEVLATVPVAVARRVVRRLLVEVAGGGPPPGSATVARALDLPMGSAASLPGRVEVTAAAGWRAFAPADLPIAQARSLEVPGCTPWEPAGLEIVATTAAEPPPRDQQVLALPGVWAPRPARPDPRAVPPGGRQERLHVLLPEIGGPLEVRHRRPGDRLRTLAGRRRLQDVLVDAGVPRSARAVWPVVTVGEQVVWIPGVAVDERALRAGRTAPAVMLEARTAGSR